MRLLNELLLDILQCVDYGTLFYVKLSAYRLLQLVLANEPSLPCRRFFHLAITDGAYWTLRERQLVNGIATWIQSAAYDIKPYGIESIAFDCKTLFYLTPIEALIERTGFNAASQIEICDKFSYAQAIPSTVALFPNLQHLWVHWADLDFDWTVLRHADLRKLATLRIGTPATLGSQAEEELLMFIANNGVLAGRGTRRDCARITAVTGYAFSWDFADRVIHVIRQCGHLATVMLTVNVAAVDPATFEKQPSAGGTMKYTSQDKNVFVFVDAAGKNVIVTNNSEHERMEERPYVASIMKA